MKSSFTELYPSFLQFPEAVVMVYCLLCSCECIGHLYRIHVFQLTPPHLLHAAWGTLSGKIPLWRDTASAKEDGLKVDWTVLSDCLLLN